MPYGTIKKARGDFSPRSTPVSRFSLWGVCVILGVFLFSRSNDRPYKQKAQNKHCLRQHFYPSLASPVAFLPSPAMPEGVQERKGGCRPGFSLPLRPVTQWEDRGGRSGRGLRRFVTDLVSDEEIRASKAQHILPWRSYCPGRSRKRSGNAGAWTVPPGGLRFHQLALPHEGGARRGRGAKGASSLLLFRTLLLFSALMAWPVL